MILLLEQCYAQGLHMQTFTICNVLHSHHVEGCNPHSFAAALDSGHCMGCDKLGGRAGDNAAVELAAQGMNISVQRLLGAAFEFPSVAVDTQIARERLLTPLQALTAACHAMPQVAAECTIPCATTIVIIVGLQLEATLKSHLPMVSDKLIIRELVTTQPAALKPVLPVNCTTSMHTTCVAVLQLLSPTNAW